MNETKKKVKNKIQITTIKAHHLKSNRFSVRNKMQKCKAADEKTSLAEKKNEYIRVNAYFLNAHI